MLMSKEEFSKSHVRAGLSRHIPNEAQLPTRLSAEGEEKVNTGIHSRRLRCERSHPGKEH